MLSKNLKKSNPKSYRIFNYCVQHESWQNKCKKINRSRNKKILIRRSYELISLMIRLIFNSTKPQYAQQVENSEYLKGLFVTSFYEFIISIDAGNVYKEDKDDIILPVLKKSLSLFISTKKQPINPEWKGADYYYKKIFKVPRILEGIVPPDIYQARASINLNDSIYCHPLASHGFMEEKYQEYRQLTENNVLNY